jgi:hypothetical protein
MTGFPAQSWGLGLALPLLVILVAAVTVPRGLTHALPRTLPAVVLNLALSAVALYALGAAALVVARVATTPGLGGLIEADPAGALRWAAGLGALPVVLWLPILGFVGLGIAQDVAGQG